MYDPVFDILGKENVHFLPKNEKKDFTMFNYINSKGKKIPATFSQNKVYTQNNEAIKILLLNAKNNTFTITPYK